MLAVALSPRHRLASKKADIGDIAPKAKLALSKSGDTGRGVIDWILLDRSSNNFAFHVVLLVYTATVTVIV